MDGILDTRFHIATPCRPSDELNALLEDGLNSLGYRRRRQATNAQRRSSQRAAQIHERSNYRFRARQYTGLPILECR